ncbi:MAG: hypothetical protein ACTHN4_01235 [Sphingomicrobium sp.]
MGLYPHSSRRKRAETAITVALLWLCGAGLFAFLIYGEGERLGPDISDIIYFTAAGVVGLIALIAYVRGGRR